MASLLMQFGALLATLGFAPEKVEEIAPLCFGLDYTSLENAAKQWVAFGFTPLQVQNKVHELIVLHSTKSTKTAVSGASKPAAVDSFIARNFSAAEKFGTDSVGDIEIVPLAEYDKRTRKLIGNTKGAALRFAMPKGGFPVSLSYDNYSHKWVMVADYQDATGEVVIGKAADALRAMADRLDAVILNDTAQAVRETIEETIVQETK